MLLGIVHLVIKAQNSVEVSGMMHEMISGVEPGPKSCLTEVKSIL